MKIAKKENKGLNYTFKITVPADEFQKEYDEKLMSVAGKVKLAGFRPGKAPKNVVEQKYGAAVRGETAEKIINDATKKAFDENDIRPANTPKIDIVSFEDGKDLEFTVAVEVLPEVKMVDFSKIAVEKMVAKVGEKEVQDALDRLKQARQETEKSDEVRPTQKDDIIVIDFTGYMDGKPFRGGEGKDYYLKLGSNTFIPGFEDQLTGKNIGEKTTVHVKFPEDYHAKDMADKEADFEVEIKELRKMKEVEINDEFAKMFGQESVEKLKQMIEDTLSKEYDGISKIHLKRAVLDALAPMCKFDAPESMVSAEFDGIWKQFEDAKKRGEIDEDEKKKSEDDLKKEYRAIAERRVKLGLLLAEIANQNKITLAKEDISKAIMQEAQRYPGQEKQVFEFYAKNEQAMNALKAPIFEEKVIDFVISQIKVSEKTLSVADLYAYDPDKK